MKTLIAFGAYGRQATENDWIEARDFKSLQHNSYFSKRDTCYLVNEGFTNIEFYKSLPDIENPPTFTITL